MQRRMIMKKVKEILAILLVLALTFTFAACSNSKPSSEGSDSDQADTNSKPSEEKKVQGISDTLPEFDKSGTIQETHLADVYGVSITATGLSYTNSAVKLSLKLENNSDAKREAYAGTTGYGCNSVNGYMIHDGYMWCQLDPGAVEEEEISFSYAELYFHGINKIAEIGIGFDVSDDDFNHEHSDMIIVKTQIADSYNYNEDTYLKTMKGNSLQNAYGITVDALSENTAYSEGNVCLISQAIVTNKDGSVRTIEVKGLFVAVGRIPENQNFASLVELDPAGYAVAGEDCRTKTPGVFVAGDNRTKNVRQLVTAAADGAVAATAAIAAIADF